MSSSSSTIGQANADDKIDFAQNGSLALPSSSPEEIAGAKCVHRFEGSEKARHRSKGSVDGKRAAELGAENDPDFSDQEPVAEGENEVVFKKATPFVKRMVYIAEFIKDIALWVGGFTVVNLTARAKLDHTIVLLLMLSFIGFSLGLICSFIASLAAAIWFTETAEPTRSDKGAWCVRITMIISGILCLVGLILVVVTLFIIKDKAQRTPTA